MNRSVSVLLGLASAHALLAQGHPIDWPLFGGDPQRSGWEKTDWRITRENVKDFQLVLKHPLDNKLKGARSLTPPVVIGLLISYRGFKELAFVAGSGDNFWAIDADLDRVFWQTHFDAPGGKARSVACAGAATPSLVPPLNFAAGGSPSAGAPKPALPFLSPAHFGEPRPVFALSSDGKLRILNTADGTNLIPPMPFLPAGALASSLTFSNGIVYTTTSGGCGGAPDALWAIDLNAATRDTPGRVSQFAVKPQALSPLGGLAIAGNGTVFAQTSNALLALGPADLKVKATFPIPGAGSGKNAAAATPVTFRYKERDLVAAGAADGRLYLLDAAAPAGDDAHAPLFQSAPVAAAGGSIWGGLSTWEDSEGVRWIAAPVWGPVAPDIAALASTAAPPHGAIVAFRLEEHDGKPLLTPVWISRDMPSPEPPVITAGTVFVLAAGEYGRDGRPRRAAHATLFALDGATGKEIYSSGNQVTAPAALTGLAIANARVYFTTADNTLYAFGIFLER